MTIRYDDARQRLTPGWLAARYQAMKI